MSYRTDIAYCYDGSFDGLMCCVFESYVSRESPALILSPDQPQATLFPVRNISTDPAHAARVLKAIPARIGPEADSFIWKAHLTCAPERDVRILAFLRLGFRAGAAALDMRCDDNVSALHKAVLSLENEAHHFKGFIRFTDFDGALSSVIEPKNRVLPLIAPHFRNRLPQERFLIFDRTHKEALACQSGRMALIPLEDVQLPDPNEAERTVRALWRRFHQALCIEERKNPNLQRTHLPLRFRAQMTEFQPDDLPHATPWLETEEP